MPFAEYPEDLLAMYRRRGRFRRWIGALLHRCAVAFAKRIRIGCR